MSTKNYQKMVRVSKEVDELLEALAILGKATGNAKTKKEIVETSVKKAAEELQKKHKKIVEKIAEALPEKERKIIEKRILNREKLPF